MVCKGEKSIHLTSIHAYIREHRVLRGIKMLKMVMQLHVPDVVIDEIDVFALRNRFIHLCTFGWKMINIPVIHQLLDLRQLLLNIKGAIANIMYNN